MTSNSTIPVSRPSINEFDKLAVQNALENLEVSGHSQSIQEFEFALSSYLEGSHVVAVSSGTSAIDLISDYLGVDETSTVICPTFSIISTLLEFVRRKAKIVLIDAHPHNWSLDLNLVQNYLHSDKPVEVLIGTHIYNSAFDVDLARKLCSEFNVSFVEDAAEAFGSTWNDRKLGTFGDYGIFSFYANKLITTGEGGAIVTSSAQASNGLKILRNLGFDPNERFIHRVLGRNVRLNGLSAALGISQLTRVEALKVHRENLYHTYMIELGDLPELSFQNLQFTESKLNSSFWVMPILLHEEAHLDASSLQEKLKEKGIESRRFFCPMHLQPVLKDYLGSSGTEFPISELLWKRGLYLPLGSGIKKSEVERVCEEVRRIFS